MPKHDEDYWINHPLNRDPCTEDPETIAYLMKYVATFHSKRAWLIPFDDQFNIAYLALLSAQKKANTISDPHARANYINKTIFGRLMNARFHTTQSRYRGRSCEIREADNHFPGPPLRHIHSDYGFESSWLENCAEYYNVEQKDPPLTPEDVLIQSDRLALIAQNLNQLTPTQAEIVIDILFNHMSIKQTADARHVSPQAVAQSMEYAVIALRKALKSQGVL